MQLSTAVRNARLNAIAAAIGAAPVLEIRSGGLPANTAADRTGTVLATVALPSTWMADASGGSKSKTGTWADASADNSGEAGYFTIYDTEGVAHIQGTCAVSGADMLLSTVSFNSGQAFTVTSFTLTDANG